MYKLMNLNLSAKLYQAPVKYNETRCIHLHTINWSYSPYLQFHGNMGKRFLHQHPYNLIMAKSPNLATLSSRGDKAMRATAVPGAPRRTEVSVNTPGFNLQSFSHSWMRHCLPLSPSRPEEDQRWLRAAQAGRWTSGALRSPLPVSRRASGL